MQYFHKVLVNGEVITESYIDYDRAVEFAQSFIDRGYTDVAIAVKFNGIKEDYE